MDLLTIELGCLPLALLVTIGFYLLHDRGAFGAQAFRRFNVAMRRDCVAGVLSKPGSEVHVVQTLRNSIMSASVMASTSILLFMATLTLVTDPDKFVNHWLGAALVTATPWLWKLKVGSLLLTLFIAFWYYAQAIRVFNHAGYFLTNPVRTADDESIDRGAGLLNTAGQLYSSGNRCFYFAVPLAFWWFGAGYLLCATAVKLLVSYLTDRRALH